MGTMQIFAILLAGLRVCWCYFMLRNPFRQRAVTSLFSCTEQEPGTRKSLSCGYQARAVEVNCKG